MTRVATDELFKVTRKQSICFGVLTLDETVVDTMNSEQKDYISKTIGVVYEEKKKKKEPSIGLTVSLKVFLFFSRNFVIYAVMSVASVVVQPT